MQNEDLKQNAGLCVKKLSRQLWCNESAHIGGCLSMVETLITLYGEFLKHDPANPAWEKRDYFILSKGHCVLGYLAVLNNFGYFSESKLKTFQSNGSDFIAHPVKNIQLGIESSNGSLGQGLSYVQGMATSFKKRKRKQYFFWAMGNVMKDLFGKQRP